jgi:hypothetical protein
MRTHLHHDYGPGPESFQEHQAWTAPRTWVTSEVVTATMMNTHVRDNLLAINSTPKVLVAHGGGIPQSGAGTWHTVTWDAEVYDTDGMYSAGANDRITIQTSGVYWVYGRYMQDATDAAIGVRLLANGATLLDEHYYEYTHNHAIGFVGVAWGLSAGHYVQLQGRSHSGVGNSDIHTKMGAVRLSD